ncbi:MAG: S-layer homology domain-containing protein [Clostridia bacterium]|nr:S-layer homology domain-containing protein [Clostridia bacterium]
MRNKKLVSLFLSILIMLGSLANPPVFANIENNITVYFSLSIYGEFATDKTGNSVALSPVELTGKQSYTMDDVFIKAHEVYYGNTDGYEKTTPSDGSPYVTKLWGDTSLYFGYQVNAGSEDVWSLEHEVKNGDCIDAAIYKNEYPDTEFYSYFDKYNCVAAANKEITLNIYEKSFTDVTGIPCNNADIYINGNYADITTSSDGIVNLCFDQKGKYTISAKKTKTLSNGVEVPAITAPVCKITVKDATDVMHNIAKKYSVSSLVNDANLPWFVADLASYNEAFPENEYKFDTQTKQILLDKLIEKADSATSPGDLAKYIIGIRALGYDAKNVVTKDLKNIDIVKKLTTLVDNKDSKIANIYTLPYVIIALRQGSNYATVEQTDYLLDLAMTNKTSWVAPAWGMTDNISPVILALSPYYNSDNSSIKEAIDEALTSIKNAQSITGSQAGYGGTPSSSSTGLAIAAFSAIGTDAETVTKNGKSLIDGLMYTVNESFDGFNPVTNTIGTEQGFRGLVAWKLLKNNTGKTLYDFYANPMSAAIATPKINSDATASDGEISSGNTSSTPNPGTTNNISINIKVMTHNSASCNNSLTYKSNSSQFTPIANDTLKLEKGKTVYDALEKLLTDKGISFVEGSRGYISSINGLEEMQHGSNSGWMYTVNGNHVTQSCREKVLTGSCNIVWFYTDDYTREKGSSSFSSSGSSTVKTPTISDVINDTALYLYNQKINPSIGSTGGEWLIFGLSRSDVEIPNEYYIKYYEKIKNQLKENSGILHKTKYTEYSRVTIALTSIGIDAQNVGGYNIIMPLADYKKIVSQGINSPIWALIALDCGKYEIPLNNDAEIQATRQMYVDYILAQEKENGGWSLSSESTDADADITAMALIALSNYKKDEKVNAAIERGLDVLSKIQNKNGGYDSGYENAESTAQVLNALSSLGISYKDARFTKNKNTTVSAILKYYKKGKGFLRDGKANQMTTEQCMYALVAANRCANNQNNIFDMSDAIDIGIKNNEFGLVGKNKDVNYMPVMYPGKTFDDIAEYKSKEKIEKLTQKGIITGVTAKKFEPERQMTRAEFATIIVRALGLKNNFEIKFNDVKYNDWHYKYVATAYGYGIVNGESEETFNPDGYITKEEAATMIARAAKLCGMETEITDDYRRDVLSAFTDYKTVSLWAEDYVAFVYDTGILNNNETEINPQYEITRGQMADIIYNLLNKAELL